MPRGRRKVNFSNARSSGQTDRARSNRFDDEEEIGNSVPFMRGGPNMSSFNAEDDDESGPFMFDPSALSGLPPGMAELFSGLGLGGMGMPGGGVEPIEESHWLSFWDQVLRNLQKDDFLYYLFQQSIQSIQDAMNPLYRALGSQALRSDRVLEAVFLESGLAGSPTGLSDFQISEDDDLPKVIDIINQLKQESNDNSNEEVKEPEEEKKDDEEDENSPENIKRVLQWGVPISEVKVNTWEAQHSYPFQFVARVDQATKNLVIDMFRFVPQQMPDDVIRSMSVGPSLQLLQYFKKQLPRFEVSRNLRMEIPFDQITGIHVFKSNRTDGSALLAIELSKPPGFLTRRLNCSSKDLNAFKQRKDFTDRGQATKYRRIYFGLSEDWLRPLLLSLIVANPEFKELISKGITDVSDDTIQYEDVGVDSSQTTKSDTKEKPKPYSLNVPLEDQPEESNEPEQEAEVGYCSDANSEDDEPEWPGWLHNKELTEDDVAQGLEAAQANPELMQQFLASAFGSMGPAGFMNAMYADDEDDEDYQDDEEEDDEDAEEYEDEDDDGHGSNPRQYFYFPGGAPPPQQGGGGCAQQ